MRHRFRVQAVVFRHQARQPPVPGLCLSVETNTRVGQGDDDAAGGRPEGRSARSPGGGECTPPAGVIHTCMRGWVRAWGRGLVRLKNMDEKIGYHNCRGAPLLEYRTLKVDPDYRLGSDGSMWSKKSGEWVQAQGTPDRDGYPRIKMAGKRHKSTSSSLRRSSGPVAEDEGLPRRHQDRQPAQHRLGNRPRDSGTRGSPTGWSS